MKIFWPEIRYWFAWRSARVRTRDRSDPACGSVRFIVPVHLDRKSTRLNSSHGYISYAVFCLKKKKNSLSMKPDMSTPREFHVFELRFPRNKTNTVSPSRDVITNECSASASLTSATSNVNAAC